MDNINPYDKESFKEEFPNTKYYRLIKELYPTAEISYDPLTFTTREELFLDHNTVDATPFYYLQYLNSDATVYDLGCGFNFFKPFFKNLVGVDPYDERADRDDIVDVTYYKEHESCYESLFSINALHFVPIHYLRDVVEGFVSMLKPNCTGFIALNIARMLERTNNRHWNPYSNNDINFLQGWIRKQFNDLPYKFKVVDIDLSTINQYNNGNIRLVITRPS